MCGQNEKRGGVVESCSGGFEKMNTPRHCGTPEETAAAGFQSTAEKNTLDNHTVDTDLKVAARDLA